MQTRRIFALLSAFALVCVSSQGATPPLLKEAMQNWSEGKDDIAFTQKTRFLHDDGKVKEERVERYDPSLPDNKRWKLISVDGKDPTNEQRERIEVKRNKKPRKKAAKPLEQYFDMENATAGKETKEAACFDVSVRPETARLIAVDKITVELTVDKKTKMIERVTAGLDEPMRIAMGVAKVTDVDLDVRFDGDDEKPKKGEPAMSPDTATGTAEVKMSKFGNRAEYSWADFKRVTRYQGGSTAAATEPEPAKAQQVTNKSKDRR